MPMSTGAIFGTVPENQTSAYTFFGFSIGSVGDMTADNYTVNVFH